MNDGLIDRVRLLREDILAQLLQLLDYITPLRPQFIRIVKMISDAVTELCSELVEKSVMVAGMLERLIEDLMLEFTTNKISGESAEEIFEVVRKLTVLERQIENLETSGRGDSRARNELNELKAKVRDLTVELGYLRERNMSLEREIRDKMSTIDRLRSRMDQVDESLALNTVKIADMESQRAPRAQQTIHSCYGTLLWKIDGYQRKRRDAINGVKAALYSHPFYSAQYGYKMCAKIYMNGDGFGKGSHLSLFFVVMKGDYDALQTWPFQKKITMMLLDQGNGDHVIDAFYSDPQSSSFQRPKSDMNIASGSPLFMPLDSLSNRQYIKDDVMFVKIIVD